MKQPYGEGLASHTDPESCVVSREAGHEALTGAHAGGVSSREISGNQDADAVYSAGRQYWWVRYREHLLDLRGQRPLTAASNHPQPAFANLDPRGGAGQPASLPRFDAETPAPYRPHKHGPYRGCRESLFEETPIVGRSCSPLSRLHLRREAQAAEQVLKSWVGTQRINHRLYLEKRQPIGVVSIRLF